MMNVTDFGKNIIKAGKGQEMILPNGTTFSMNGIKTRRNNNVIAMGTSGSSKTRSFVIPNLLSCSGSYIVSDPKGSLYRKYADYMKRNGYNVIHLDFIHPEKSDGYNPLAFANTPDEIAKLAHYITYAGKNKDNRADPFWDKSAEILLSAIIGYFADSNTPPSCRTMSAVSELLTQIDVNKIEEDGECDFDRTMDVMKRDYKCRNGHSAIPWSYHQYRRFRNTPSKTMSCILLTVQSNIGILNIPEISAMMSKTNIDFTAIAKQKTVVFAEVSDTDRSRDMLVNTFYSQAMNQLCMFADEECENGCLPIPVRFILDDFGTNCRIDGFENMISNIRSRNISASIILQSESQLEKGYGESAHTIMDNCDTLIYMGGNDVETATTISLRANKPLNDILNMPVSTNWTFRRGEKPVYSRTIDIDEYEIPTAKHIKVRNNERENENELHRKEA